MESHGFYDVRFGTQQWYNPFNFEICDIMNTFCFKKALLCCTLNDWGVGDSCIPFFTTTCMIICFVLSQIHIAKDVFSTHCTYSVGNSNINETGINYICPMRNHKIKNKILTVYFCSTE